MHGERTVAVTQVDLQRGRVGGQKRLQAQHGGRPPALDERGAQGVVGQGPVREGPALLRAREADRGGSPMSHDDAVPSSPVPRRGNQARLQQRRERREQAGPRAGRNAAREPTPVEAGHGGLPLRAVALHPDEPPGDALSGEGEVGQGRPGGKGRQQAPEGEVLQFAEQPGHGRRVQQVGVGAGDVPVVPLPPDAVSAFAVGGDDGDGELLGGGRIPREEPPGHQVLGGGEQLPHGEARHQEELVAALHDGVGAGRVPDEGAPRLGGDHHQPADRAEVGGDASQGEPAGVAQPVEQGQHRGGIGRGALPGRVQDLPSLIAGHQPRAGVGPLEPADPVRVPEHLPGL